MSATFSAFNVTPESDVLIVVFILFPSKHLPVPTQQ